MSKFETGQMVMTVGINDSIADSEIFAKEITKIISRYLSCDWGDMSAADKQANNEAVLNGDDRIFAAYNSSQGKVYVITEWDRSYTTVLFADEY